MAWPMLAAKIVPRESTTQKLAIVTKKRATLLKKNSLKCGE